MSFPRLVAAAIGLALPLAFAAAASAAPSQHRPPAHVVAATFQPTHALFGGHVHMISDRHYRPRHRRHYVRHRRHYHDR